MERSSEELISDYQNGDKTAFEALFQRHKKAIFNFAYRMLGNRADAEDATAEVFMVLHAKKDSYQPHAKFTTWLFTVARNSCIDRMRKTRNILSLWTQNTDGDYTSWDVPDQRPTHASELEGKEAGEIIREAIGRLPPNQKEALILREYHDLSYDEISAILKCSLENVKILIFRARERLRTELSSLLTEGR